jgi:hypothetical protein
MEARKEMERAMRVERGGDAERTCAEEEEEKSYVVACLTALRLYCFLLKLDIFELVILCDLSFKSESPCLLLPLPWYMP